MRENLPVSIEGAVVAACTCMQLSNFDTALEILESRERSSQYCGKDLLEIGVDASVRLGRIQRAQEHLKTMLERQMEPSVRTYSVLLDAHIKQRDFAGLWKILSKVLRKSTPQELSYHTLVKEYIRDGLLGEARATIMEMVSRGVKPERTPIDNLIESYSTSLSLAKDANAQALSEGPTPNAL
uniref:Pentacotripeptide-repeat region of PRORP domain-containing protein n=2 Tax=Rhodosorus marinus TaxID=101924 RepID=A0A7S0BUC3_9RHOD|mmetsp:Transcript_9742/g.14194  ORF Transcript_9742/g.14194 Transcript_9742/m.14194 type:complete len:183 (+) Transcript_9742:1-549(+)